jgi:hypothetical protein
LGLVGAVHSAVSAVLKLPPTRSTHARRQTVGREREGEEGKRERETGHETHRETGDGNGGALRRRLRYLSQTHTHTHGLRVPPATPPVALLSRRHRGRSYEVGDIEVGAQRHRGCVSESRGCVSELLPHRWSVTAWLLPLCRSYLYAAPTSMPLLPLCRSYLYAADASATSTLDAPLQLT